eukprot:TRINITY_DN57701_c0_g1_i1.p1 TRINITY_DN57701_c0_g1~~TRINITY_DN57701_c0_g1_i1.p1  ORF type:complete len:247 (-),score=30.61 TRINITY_DN57701_c0_g1_i1:223-963(-)
MHVSTSGTELVAGAWAGVRRHPKKVLPVQWGIFKKRYCLAGPSRMCYFKRNNLTAEPDEIVACDGIQRHPENARVACLQRYGQAVAWLILLDAAKCERFIAAASPVIQALSMDVALINGYTAEQHQRAVMEFQLQQAKLARQETELSPCRARLPEDRLSPDMVLSESIARSFPGSRGAIARSLSRSSSSSSDDEPLAPALSRGVVMDWPLSRAEKKVRLMQIMDRERTAVEKQNRRLKRRSCPDRM